MRISAALLWTCTAFRASPAAAGQLPPGAVSNASNASVLTARCAARRATECALRNATGAHASFLARGSKKLQSGGIVVEAHPKDAPAIRSYAAHIGYLNDCFDVPFEENYYVPEGKMQVKVNVNARDIDGDSSNPDSARLALCEAIWYAGLMTANSDTECDGHMGFRQASCPEQCPATDSMSGCA